MSRYRFPGVAALLLSLAAIACAPAANSATREGRTASGLAWDVRGSGPPVVLIHGAMLDRRQWDPQAPLADRFTVIRYDTRWHGISAGADAPFRATDDLAAVLDTVGVDQVSVIGLSHGAQIAVDFALAHPERVAALVLVSPGLGGYQPMERPDFWAPMMEMLSAGNHDSAAALLARSPVMVVNAENAAWVEAMVRDQATVFGQNPAFEQQPDPPAIRRLGEIRVPTLVITGGADLRDIALTGDTLEQGIPGARRVVIPHATHLLTISHAAEFNRLVTDFLPGGDDR